MKRLFILTAMAALLLPGMANAGWVLYDWSANIDGSTFNPPGLPSSVDSSGFDFGTGLGSLIFTFTDPGSHYAGVYFNHYDDSGYGDVTDAYATVFGIPPGGLSFETDDPNLGVLWADFQANTLQNTNLVSTYSPPPTACCEVGMAEIYAFTLSAGYQATLKFTVGPGIPTGGFFLQETDHDTGDTIALTQSYAESPIGNPIPEPGTWLLLAGGAGLLWGARRRS